MPTSPITVEVLIRDGANGSHAIWAAYRAPGSSEITTFWGTARRPDGSIVKMRAGNNPPTMEFSNKKAVAGKALGSLYDGKRRKYASLGQFTLDVARLIVTPVRAGSPQPADSGVQERKASTEPKPSALPKEIAFPEAFSEKPSGVSWFF